MTTNTPEWFTQQTFADLINHPHALLVGDFYRNVTRDGDEGWDWSSQETQYGYESRSRFPRYELLEQTDCVLKAAVDEQVAAKHWKSSRGLFAVVAYNGLPQLVVAHFVTQPQDN